MKTGNPMADALSAAILAHDLPRDRLAGMIAARIPEITGDPPASLQDLRVSLLETEGACCSSLPRRSWGAPARPGKRQPSMRGWLMGLCKGCARFRSRRPAQAAAASVLPCRAGARMWSGFTRARPSTGLAAALADFRDEASRELQRFRELRARLDRAAWPAFLPLALVEPYLKAMAAGSFDPLAHRPALNPVAPILADLVRGVAAGSLASLAVSVPLHETVATLAQIVRSVLFSQKREGRFCERGLGNEQK